MLSVHIYLYLELFGSQTILSVNSLHEMIKTNKSVICSFVQDQCSNYKMALSI